MPDYWMLTGPLRMTHLNAIICLKTLSIFCFLNLSAVATGQERDKPEPFLIETLLTKRLNPPDGVRPHGDDRALDFNLGDGTTFTIVVVSDGVAWSGIKTNLKALDGKEVAVHGIYTQNGKNSNYVLLPDRQYVYLEWGARERATLPEGIKFGDAIRAVGKLHEIKNRPSDGFGVRIHGYYLEKSHVTLKNADSEQPFVIPIQASRIPTVGTKQ